MGYISLEDCINELEKTDQLIRIKEEVDPNLEMAYIHRRVQEAGGPALLFENVKGSPFRAASNLYGTNERTEYIFRQEIETIETLAQLRLDPAAYLKKPFKLLSLLPKAIKSLPKKVSSSDLTRNITQIHQLPQIKSWPKDGGAFVTLPQVLSVDPEKPGIKNTNIGMYRIQMSGNDYELNKEIGLHYQIHRGIGVHHQQYNNLKKPFKVSINVGGPPSHTIAAVLPLPEGFSETIFSGLLNDRRYRYIEQDGYYLSAEADFCITGIIDPEKLKEEGPFGDHLGYYSLSHPFPLMHVDKVYHKTNAIWHFTVVGRPPAEDSGFGYLIHRLFGSTVQSEFPGLKKVHAVDAAGVHPLLFAIGSERYMPFRDQRPEEILTIANRLLGSGQTSLAKYLFITAQDADIVPDVYDVKGFLKYTFERIDFNRDLHFITKTTIDTLDYSGDGLNHGSKLIVAAYGPPLRQLNSTLPHDLLLPPGFQDPKFFTSGILCVKGPKYENRKVGHAQAGVLASYIERFDWQGVALIVICDDVDFTIATDNNFVWITFTRSNPAANCYGLNERMDHKHWSIDAPLIIDARIKPHHAPVLEDEPKVVEKANRFFTSKGPLSKWG
ncbi:UbiD family decarboxylase [Candidatus Brachybacter algidus]|uniref:UbiD family decarboxylase n=1 Tax=Candidatus Brachybacter algidus TaxID=2982024 RepID=UPI001DBB3E79|nr:UbiD family decarboxylase [Candidatus Brachybacter algidus]MBK6448086.1 UbiD family decarboxylase [Candidatus Brachybacter algidus]